MYIFSTIFQTPQGQIPIQKPQAMYFFIYHIFISAIRFVNATYSTLVTGHLTNIVLFT
ncbi:MAG: hypothetical protein N2511_08260 [Thermodesulfovibrionales bacterium]|nr:hypothetical protein [Thermodesulfovibrionales bacterium]